MAGSEVTDPKNLNDDVRYGPDPAEWRPEYDEAFAKYLRPSVTGTPVITTSTPALPAPHWMKQEFGEPPQLPKPGTYAWLSDGRMSPPVTVPAPGHVSVWSPGPSSHGHVEVVTRRQAWRYRLATWKRCLMWWKP